MEININVSGIVDYQHPCQGLTDIQKSGFTSISLDIEKAFILKSKQTTEDFFTEYLHQTHIFFDSCKTILEKIKTENLSVCSMRSPTLQLDTKRSDLNEAQKLMAIDTITAASEINCRYVIIAPITFGIDKSDIWNENRKYYLSIAQKAKDKGVNILIENQCSNFNGQFMRGLFSNEYEATAFIDEINQIVGEERFGFCMNVANCNLCGIDMHNLAKTLGKRVKAVVISDCDGQNDMHLLPFTSAYHGNQTDWLSLIRGLREAEFDGYIILDISDTAKAFSPILRPQLLSLTKSVADYFKWQLEIELLLKKCDKRVLFGAGNMCRNYMKCYGAKYPPMFTCDNNSKMWGTIFCGLEVKNPEELKGIPDDCAIFICNIYYREIEQQLRDMGITNPIEYFNDEYMPSFYFDRLNGV